MWAVTTSMRWRRHIQEAESKNSGHGGWGEGQAEREIQNDSNGEWWQQWRPSLRWEIHRTGAFPEHVLHASAKGKTCFQFQNAMTEKQFKFSPAVLKWLSMN